MFEIIFAIALFLYIIQTVIFFRGMLKKYHRIDDSALPTATVVVAARNEEDKILDCLISLNKLDYPEGKLEIVIAEDQSTDNTRGIIKTFVRDKKRFRLFEVDGEKKGLKGKANAIAQALQTVSSEIILTTDADCTVSPTWARTICSYYTDDVAMVCGYTNQTDNTLFEGMQAADFIYLLGVAAGTINLGKPLSCIGNNMSYRKSAYDRIGGYESMPFSVTEDFQILAAIHKLGEYKIIYPADPGAMVISKPCADYPELYKQKKRWAVGGLESDIIGFAVMASGFILHLLMLALPFFFSFLAIGMAVVKILTDYLFLLFTHRLIGQKILFKNFIAFEIYFILYVFILPFTVIFNRRVVWKGRKY